MSSIILSFHVIVAVLLIGLILVQHGKGADAGAAFGSGASSTVFGSQGSASFLTRLTAGLATAFFITSLILAYNTKAKVTGQEEVDIPTPIEQIKDETVSPSVPTSKDDKPTLPMSLNQDMPAKTGDKPTVPTKSDIPE